MASASALNFAIAILTVSAFHYGAIAQDTSVSSTYNQQNLGLGQYRPTTQTTYGQGQLPSVSGGACTDHLQKCSFWASTGECYTNPTYMHAYCKQSCGDCNGGSTGSTYGAPQPITPVTVGYNAISPVSTTYGRGSGSYLGGLTGSYGYGNTGYGSSGYGNTGYGNTGYGNTGYGSTVYPNTGYGNTGYGSNVYGNNGYGSGQPLTTYCTDLHSGCVNWAAYGHCTINPTYMLQYCRQSCGSCNTPGLPTYPQQPYTQQPYPQQPYLGQGSNGYGNGYTQPIVPSTYGGIQQPINGGYNPSSYGQTASGYGQTSSTYGQTSSTYTQPESTYSQQSSIGNSFVSEVSPSGYNSLGTSYVSPTATTGEYTEKKEKKLAAAKIKRA